MRTASVGCILILWIIPGACGAIIIDAQRISIDFTNAEDARKKATWSPSTKLTVSKDGIGWDGPSDGVRGGWIETAPLAIGRSWRPAKSAVVGLVITPAIKSVQPLNRAKPTTVGKAFVRHSPDLKHWSSWQSLNSEANEKHPALSSFLQFESDAGESSGAFSRQLETAERDRTDYVRHWREYTKLAVPWGDDQEALAKWIVEREPKFFRDHKPFLGYVQFLFTHEFHRGERIEKIEGGAFWVLSGLSSLPRIEEVDDGRRELPWRFHAN